MFQCVALLTVLLSVAQASNILVIGGVPGSHFLTSADVAQILHGFGHNVTVFSLWDDLRVSFNSSSRFHFASATNEQSSEQLAAVQATVKEAILAPSKDMMHEMIKQTGKSKENFDLFHQIAIPYFGGHLFSKLLEEGKFELIVIEDTLGYASALTLVHKNIPIIGVMSMADVR